MGDKKLKEPTLQQNLTGSIIDLNSTNMLKTDMLTCNITVDLPHNIHVLSPITLRSHVLSGTRKTAKHSCTVKNLQFDKFQFLFLKTKPTQQAAMASWNIHIQMCTCTRIC